MKKYFFLFLLVFISNSLIGQETDTTDKLNYDEIKINGLYLVLGAFDITYERTLNEESGFGVNVFLPFDDDVNDDINYYVSPYYRMYFGKKHAAGFFVEGFGMLNSVKDYSYELILGDILVETDDNVTDFALGIGVGGKWVTNRGFLGELGFGVGRNLFNSSNNGSEFVGKVGITLGYRF